MLTGNDVDPAARHLSASLAERGPLGGLDLVEVNSFFDAVIDRPSRRTKMMMVAVIIVRRCQGSSAGEAARRSAFGPLQIVPGYYILIRKNRAWRR